MSFNVDEDVSLTEDGVWVEYEDSKFKIAHASNLVFQKELARLQAPHRRKIEEGKLDMEIQRTILCKAMAKGLVRDWDKVVNKAKEPVPYSEAQCAQVLVKNTAFRQFVTDFAADLANFREETLEEVGNS